MPADCMLVPAPASARTSLSTAVKLGPCVLCSTPVWQQDTGLFFFLIPSAGTAGSGKSSAKHTHTSRFQYITHVQCHHVLRRENSLDEFSCNSCQEVPLFMSGCYYVSYYGERSSLSYLVLPNCKTVVVS